MRTTQRMTGSRWSGFLWNSSRFRLITRWITRWCSALSRSTILRLFFLGRNSLRIFSISQVIRCGPFRKTVMVFNGSIMFGFVTIGEIKCSQDSCLSGLGSYTGLFALIMAGLARVLEFLCFHDHSTYSSVPYSLTANRPLGPFIGAYFDHFQNKYSKVWFSLFLNILPGNCKSLFFSLLTFPLSKGFASCFLYRMELFWVFTSNFHTFHRKILFWEEIWQKLWSKSLQFVKVFNFVERRFQRVSIGTA